MSRLWILLSWIVALLCCGQRSDASQPDEILSTAIAVWHMQSLDDAVGSNSSLTAHGAASVGHRIEDTDFRESTLRGGDGFAAKLSGGWFDAGRGVEGELDLSDDRITALIRLKCDSPSLWSTRGFFTRGGGHDQLVFNFFSHDFDQGTEGMRVGCEIGIDGRAGLGGQVTVPVAQIGPTDWHDLLARYDGKELVLFVDGVAVHRVPVAGRLRQGNIEPLSLGAGGGHDHPFACWIDHAALWDRALSDEEVTALSGGPAEVHRARVALDAWVAPPPRPPIGELVKHSRELQTLLLADPHRPRYHLMHFEWGDIMPGDPNGAIYWKGR